MKLEKLAYLLVLIAPVTSNYIALGNLSIGDVSVIAALLLLSRFVQLSYWALAGFSLTLFLVVISFLILIDAGQVDPGFARLLFYSLASIYIIYGLRVNHKLFQDSYCRLGLFFSWSIIIQWLVYHLVGLSIPLQFPYFFIEQDTLKVIDHVFRSGGFFKEPSYFLLFILPLFFHYISNENYSSILTLLVAALMSTSSLFLLVILFAPFYFRSKFRSIILISPLIFITLFYIFFIYNYGQFTMMDRVIDIFSNGGTLNERVFASASIIFPFNIFGSPSQYFNFLNDAVWYPSSAAISSSFGWLFLLIFLLSYFKLGLPVGLIFCALIFSTHIVSSSYVFFLTMCFMSLQYLYARNPTKSR